MLQTKLRWLWQFPTVIKILIMILIIWIVVALLPLRDEIARIQTIRDTWREIMVELVGLLITLVCVDGYIEHLKSPQQTSSKDDRRNVAKNQLRQAHTADERQTILKALIQDDLFTQSHWTYANFEGVDFSEANMVGIQLSRTNLHYAKLVGVDLRNGVLRQADMRGANLYNANLGGADFTGAIFDTTTILPDENFWRSNEDLKKFGALA